MSHKNERVLQSTEKIVEEFFMQGDLEKILFDHNKQTFDRESTDIAQLQIGCITHIVYPTVNKFIFNQ